LQTVFSLRECNTALFLQAECQRNNEEDARDPAGGGPAMEGRH